MVHSRELSKARLATLDDSFRLLKNPCPRPARAGSAGNLRRTSPRASERRRHALTLVGTRTRTRCAWKSQHAPAAARQLALVGDEAHLAARWVACAGGAVVDAVEPDRLV
eukprot:7147589-Prymnesium_polylepis.1